MNLDSHVVATKAIIIHQADIEMISFDELKQRKSRCILTVHDVLQSNKGPVIGAGQAMSDIDREMLRSHLNGEKPEKAMWWPENLLFRDAYQMVWYVPPAKRNMYFRSGTTSKKFSVMWPGLVMSYKLDKGFRIVAYAGKGRPTAGQKLYHAPLWNIDNKGVMCAGTAITASELNDEAMNVWNRAVFETNFTHPNHDNYIRSRNKSKKGRVSQAQYMKMLQQKELNGSPFCASEMEPINTTLKAWAENI